MGGFSTLTISIVLSVLWRTKRAPAADLLAVQRPALGLDGATPVRDSGGLSVKFYGLLLGLTPMHPIQRQLLELAKYVNLARLSLREMAVRIGLPDESPQKVKHHLQQLQKKGLLTIDRDGDVMRATVEPSFAANPGMTKETLFAIPIVGAANCGPATLYADQNIEGILRVSRRLVQRSSPDGLYALKADGASMNRAQIGGRSIEDGDYVIVDSNEKTPRPNDIVVAIVDGKATIKKFIVDKPNNQIVLRAQSLFDYEPIHLHPEDDFNISGKAIAVIKRASP